MGIALAVTSVSPQIRHGAGKNTEANASIAWRKITDVLLTVRELERERYPIPVKKGRIDGISHRALKHRYEEGLIAIERGTRADR